MKYPEKLALRVLIILLLFLIYNYIYIIALPVTTYLSFIVLKILQYNPTLIGNSISVNNITFSFISACVALPAYYLLLILLLTTKDLNVKSSIKLFFIGSLLILAMNIIRIDLLIAAFTSFGKQWFDKLHIIFWKFVSGVYVAIIWIFLTKKYKIKSMPVYTDLKYLYNKSLLKNRFKK